MEKISRKRCLLILTMVLTLIIIRAEAHRSSRVEKNMKEFGGLIRIYSNGGSKKEIGVKDNE